MNNLCKGIVACLAITFTAFSSLGQQGGDPPRPNILLIVTDDQGWADIGYHNDEVRTPHLDRLASMGVQLAAH